MKKYLLAIAIFFTVTSKAQITLEYSNDTLAFGERFYCIDIGNNDFKYVLINEAANNFSLFNMDMSAYIANVSIPVTDSIKNGFIVTYVTKTLFDCDSSNIEYVYEAPYGSTRYPFYIFRTDGTSLLKVDSARGPYCFGCFGGG